MKALLFSLLIHAALFLFLLLWRPAPYVEQKESHQKEIAFSLVSEPNHTVSVIRKDQADNLYSELLSEPSNNLDEEKTEEQSSQELSADKNFLAHKEYERQEPAYKEAVCQENTPEEKVLEKQKEPVIKKKENNESLTDLLKNRSAEVNIKYSEKKNSSGKFSKKTSISSDVSSHGAAYKKKQSVFFITRKLLQAHNNREEQKLLITNKVKAQSGFPVRDKINDKIHDNDQMRKLFLVQKYCFDKEVQKKIVHAWRKERCKGAFKLSQDTQVVIAISLDRFGNLKKCIVSHSSGNPWVDRSIKNAVLQAEPFQKPQPEFLEDGFYAMNFAFSLCV